MADWGELKRLAEACDIERCADGDDHTRRLTEFYCVVEPEDVAALIAENERLSSHAKACEGIAEHNAKSFVELMAERDQLKAELERVRTDAEVLRNIAERACLLLEKGKFKSHNAVLAMRCIEDFAAWVSPVVLKKSSRRL